MHLGGGGITVALELEAGFMEGVVEGTCSSANMNDENNPSILGVFTNKLHT